MPPQAAQFTFSIHAIFTSHRLLNPSTRAPTPDPARPYPATYFQIQPISAKPQIHIIQFNPSLLSHTSATTHPHVFLSNFGRTKWDTRQAVRPTNREAMSKTRVARRTTQEASSKQRYARNTGQQTVSTYARSTTQATGGKVQYVCTKGVVRSKQQEQRVRSNQQ